MRILVVNFLIFVYTYYSKYQANNSIINVTQTEDFNSTVISKVNDQHYKKLQSYYSIYSFQHCMHYITKSKQEQEILWCTVQFYRQVKFKINLNEQKRDRVGMGFNTVQTKLKVQLADVTDYWQFCSLIAEVPCSFHFLRTQLIAASALSKILKKMRQPCSSVCL